MNQRILIPSESLTLTREFFSRAQTVQAIFTSSSDESNGECAVPAGGSSREDHGDCQHVRNFLAAHRAGARRIRTRARWITFFFFNPSSDTD